MDSDEISLLILNELGFELEKLPATSERKQADYVGFFDNEKYIIEAKLKTDSSEEKKAKEAKLSAGEIHIADGAQGRSEAVATIIRSSAHQIRSSAKLQEHDYKIIFILSEGLNAKIKSDNVVDTLYGRTRIIETNSTKPIMKPCYFFYHAELFRRKDEIDAVIEGYINHNNEALLQLCLNPYSNSYHKLKNNNLAKKLLSSITDPLEDESKGLCYIPDRDVPRSKTNEEYLTPLYNPMLQHLQEKYKTQPLINIDFDSPELSRRIF